MWRNFSNQVLTSSNKYRKNWFVGSNSWLSCELCHFHSCRVKKMIAGDEIDRKGTKGRVKLGNGWTWSWWRWNGKWRDVAALLENELAALLGGRENENAQRTPIALQMMMIVDGYVCVSNCSSISLYLCVFLFDGCGRERNPCISRQVQKHTTTDKYICPRTWQSGIHHI